MEKEDSKSSSPAKRASRRNRKIPSIRVTRQSTGSCRPQDMPFASGEYNMENWLSTKDRKRKEKRSRTQKKQHKIKKRNDRKGGDFDASDEEGIKRASKRKQVNENEDEEEEYVQQNSKARKRRDRGKTANRKHHMQSKPRNDDGSVGKTDEGESTSENEFRNGSDSEEEAEEDRGGDSEDDDEEYVEDDDDKEDEYDDEDYEEDEDMNNESTRNPKKHLRPRRSSEPVPMMNSSENIEADLSKPKRKRGIPRKHVVPHPTNEDSGDDDDGEYEWEDDDEDEEKSDTITNDDRKKKNSGTDAAIIPPRVTPSEKKRSREDRSSGELDPPSQVPLPPDGKAANKSSAAQESNNAAKGTTAASIGSAVIEKEANRTDSFITNVANNKEGESDPSKLPAGNNRASLDGQDPIRDPNCDKSRNDAASVDDSSKNDEQVNRKKTPTLADASSTTNTARCDSKLVATAADSSGNAMARAPGRLETPKGKNKELPEDFLARWDIIPIKIPQAARSAGKKLGMRVAKSTFPELLSGEHCLVNTTSSEGLASEYGIREGDWIVSKQMAPYEMTDYYYVAQELTRKGKPFEMQLIRKRIEGEAIESRCAFFPIDMIMNMPVEQLCLKTGRLLQSFKSAHIAKREVSSEVAPHKMKYALLGRTTAASNRRPHMFCGYFWRLKGSEKRPSPLAGEGVMEPSAPSKKRGFSEGTTPDPMDQTNGWEVSDVDTLDVAMKYNGDSTGNLKRPRLETEADTSTGESRLLKDDKRIRIVQTADLRSKDGIAAMVFRRLSLQYVEYDGDANAMPKPDTSLEPLQIEERSSGVSEGKSNNPEAESKNENDDSEKPRLFHSINVPAPYSFKRHRPTGEVALPPVLLEKDDETDALPKSLGHLPSGQRITVFDRRKGKVYSGEKGVLIEDLAAVLEGNASLEPIVPPPGSDKDCETDILREARSAPSTVVCATIRQQRPYAPTYKCGDLVRITKGEYKNEIATFERSLPSGWSELSSYPPGNPTTFWVQTGLLTTKPRVIRKKKTKRKGVRISAEKLESIFTESIDQCFQEAAEGQSNTYAADRQLTRSKEMAKKNITMTFAKHFSG